MGELRDAPIALAAQPRMQAIRITAFGGIERMEYAAIERPAPGPGQVLVRVAAAGVGPWDAWVREGRSVLPQPLPLVPGADISGVVAQAGPDVRGFTAGMAVFGATNARFTGGYAEYALADATMLAGKPARLSHCQAAALPVVASTARQALFDEARVAAGQRVLVLGAGGNVGAHVLQLGHAIGAEMIALGRPGQQERLRGLGAATVLDAEADWPVRMRASCDAVIDALGGDAQRRAFPTLRAGGHLISIVGEPDAALAAQHGVAARFMLVSVTTAGLVLLGELAEAGRLRAPLGEVMALRDARRAHAMLAGAAHRPGKIVLTVGA
ncbi:MAG: NADP-dependent oxidoreductase [Rhodospirillales bacterium]|nr:NADP-dependent oxidoreductase [Rhodospirillales bacterium]